MIFYIHSGVCHLKVISLVDPTLWCGTVPVLAQLQEKAASALNEARLYMLTHVQMCIGQYIYTLQCMCERMCLDVCGPCPWLGTLPA